MKKYNAIVWCVILLTLFSCKKDNVVNADIDLNVDLIVGVWLESGAGYKYLDGTDEYAEFNEDRCRSKVTYESNGDFTAIYYDKTDNQCTASSQDEGTWKKIDDTNYEFHIVTSTQNSQKDNTTKNLEIKFTDSDTMQFIFNPFLETQEYSYEQYDRAN